MLRITEGAQIQLQPQIKTWFFLIVYLKGNLVNDPMKSRDVVSKNVPGWGGSYRGGMGWFITIIISPILVGHHRCFRLKRAIFPTIPQSQRKQIG